MDGTKYSVTFEYQDSVGNPSSGVVHDRVSYVGSTTTDPILFEPAAYDVVPGTFLSRFTLPEDALINTAKIIVTPANSGVDSNGARELILSTKYFLQGTYEANVVGSNFDAMLSANDIISPVPSVDLLDGADYTFRLEYQDRGNNPIAGVEVSMLRFDTTRPSFTSATLNLSTGLLIIAASETLNLDTNDRSAYYAVNQTVDMAQFFLGNEGSGIMAASKMEHFPEP